MAKASLASGFASNFFRQKIRKIEYQNENAELTTLVGGKRTPTSGKGILRQHLAALNEVHPEEWGVL